VVLFHLCACEDFPLSSGESTRAISERSRPMRAGFSTETHRCMSTKEAHSLLGRRECDYRKRHHFRKNSNISVKASFELHLFVNHKT
jgi:hypothetical protein